MKRDDLSAAEKLRLTYQTGQSDERRRPDDGSTFTGLLPYSEAVERMPQPERYDDSRRDRDDERR
jgi:hypothetical protein